MHFSKEKKRKKKAIDQKKAIQSGNESRSSRPIASLSGCNRLFYICYLFFLLENIQIAINQSKEKRTATNKTKSCRERGKTIKGGRVGVAVNQGRALLVRCFT